MKKSKMILVAGLALILFALFSCEKDEVIIADGAITEEHFTLGSFSAIDISVPAKVIVAQSSEHDIAIKTYQNILNALEVKVKDDILEISVEQKNIRIDEEVEIYIHMQAIEHIDLSGLVDLKMEAFGALDELEVGMSGDSNIDFTEPGTTVDALNIDISGVGYFGGFSLASKSCTIDVSGACLVEVKVSENLTVDATGACKVHYIGDPENVTVNSSGNQEIIRVD